MSSKYICTLHLPIIFLPPILLLVMILGLLTTRAPIVAATSEHPERPRDTGSWNTFRNPSISVLEKFEQADYASDRLIVKFRSSALLPPGQVGAVGFDHVASVNLLTANGVQSVAPLFPTIQYQDIPNALTLPEIYILHLKPGQDVVEVATNLATDPNIEWIEPDYLAYDAAIPNDSLYPDQWALAQIQASTAWDIVTGTTDTIIAILDTGIDATHPDLAGRLWSNPGETPNNGIDDDTNNLIDDVNGWNFIAQTNEINDDDGHGTNVSGVAIAETNNGTGVAGMCWNCRLMAVKVMQAGGVANYSDLALGVYYAANKGAKVINISLGGYANSNTLRAAIEATANKAVIIAAAGDDNSNNPFYPAAYPEVLAVGGTTSADERASFSNYGDWVDVAAPSEAIATTQNGGGYGPTSGTSVATSLVSGLAGLVWSQHPNWSPEMVRAQVIHTADTISETELGSGRINAANAVTQVPYPLFAIASTTINGDPLGRPTPGQSVDFAITLSSDWLNVTDVMGILSTTDPAVTVEANSATYGNIASGGTAINNPLYSFMVAPGAGYNYPIAFTLDLTANDGTYTASLPLTITTRAADELVGGTIVADTTWTNDKTYIVNNNVGVAPGVTLTIQAGTVVKFNGNYSLNIGGTLIADGTGARPIRLMSNNSSNWGRIYFDDTSVDTTTDVAGTYQAGNIMRWVQVEGATHGIDCNSATPYLSHVTLLGGGVNCTPGLTTLWVQDSNLSGGLTVGGGGQVWHSTITDGGIVLSGQATVSDNTVKGNISTGNDSLVQRNVINWGGINASGASTVQNNVITGGGVSTGSNADVTENQIAGGNISTGDSVSVLTNTVHLGGIIVGTGSLVSDNNIEDTDGWGITASGTVTLTRNRVVGSENGVNVAGGMVQNNLIANIDDIGLRVGPATVMNNTITGNRGDALVIISGRPVIQNNNLEGNEGNFDLVNNTANPVDAMQNWWGTVDETIIDARVYDFYDDFTLGQVTYTPILTSPVHNAPAYIRSIILTPESPIGIESVVAEILFSRPMDGSVTPDAVFHSARKNTWQWFNVANSGIGSDDACGGSLIDSDGAIWVGSGRAWPDPAGSPNIYCDGPLSIFHPDGTWEVVSSPGDVNDLAEDVDGNVLYGYSIAIDKNTGDIWRGHPFASPSVSVTYSDNTAETFTTSNSDLVSDEVWALAVDPVNSDVWIGTWNGLSVRHADGQWQTHLPDQKVASLAIDSSGNVWAGTFDNGAWLRQAGSGRWEHFREGPYGLKHRHVVGIEVDGDGNVWFSHGRQAQGQGYGGSIFYSDGSWEHLGGPIWSIAVGDDGTAWFNVEDKGLGVRWGGTEFPIIKDGRWLSSNRWQASFDVNGLVPRDMYSVTVRSAIGADGIPIASNSAYTFTVDYIGTPETKSPPAPVVHACASTTNTTLTAQWTVPTEQSIGLYRYAIGTEPGLNDVTNWVTTTLMSVNRNNLNLLSGQTYYISVKARNTGGIWSDVGISNVVVAGAGSCPQVDFSAVPPSGMSPLSVIFTAQTTGTVTSQMWSFGNNITNTLPSPIYTYTVPGTYTVTLDVFGPGGWTTVLKDSYISVAPDTVSPTGTLVISGGVTYVSSTTVALEIVATDPSGLDSMQFSNDGVNYSAWTPYNQFDSWTLSPGDGLKTVYVRVRDIPGNIVTLTNTVILDTTPPTASVAILPTFVGTTTFTISWSGSDVYAGLERFDVQFREGADGVWTDWLTATTQTAAIYSGVHNQKTYFRARARDTLGNLGDYTGEEGDTHTTIDLLPPIGDIQVNADALYANSITVTLALSATDLSGVQAFQVSSDGQDFSEWISYTTAPLWTLAGGDGEKIVTAQYRDQVGHISAVYTDLIILDTIAPTGSITINDGATYATGTAVNLTLTATDSSSGVSQMQFSNDGANWSNWESYTTTKVWTLTNENGTKPVYVRYRDRAENIVTLSDTIILDNTAPSALVDALTPYQTNLDFTVSWDGTDVHSDIASFDVQVRTGDSSWSDWITHTNALSATFSGLDGHTFHFRARARDLLGNLSDYATGDGDTSTHLDTTRPEGSIMINGGAVDTTSRGVQLVLIANGASQVAFSNDGVNFGVWEPFPSTYKVRAYQLPPGDGLKTVYARYRDFYGNIIVYSDTITLNNSLTGDVGMSINEDAPTTEQITVTLTLKAPPGTQSMQISNGSRFVAAEWLPYRTSQIWVLAYHPNVSVYQVYVKFRNVDGTVSERYDDLITLHMNEPPPPLDSIPPSGSMVINAGAEETSMPLVTLDMLASDNPGGVGVKWMYLREWKYDPVTVQWITVRSSGWLSYVDSTSWNLAPGTGVKYIGVWFADAANNVSNPVLVDSINLILDGDNIGETEVTQYRQTFEPGQAVTVTLAMTSGDADLYIWRPGSIAVPDYWSNQPALATEQIVFTAVEGEYLIEVHGYTSSAYDLHITTMGEGSAPMRMSPQVPTSVAITMNKPLPPHPLVTSKPGSIQPPIEQPHYQIYLPLLVIP